MDVLGDHDAIGLADLVRRGEVSPAELIDAAIARIEARNPALNAVVHPLYDRARAAAGGALPDGPFRGVPFLLKDLCADLAGTPTTGSCAALAGIPATRHTTLARRYEDAGLIVVGRTNTPEFGIMGTTEPVFRGPTRNPWDTEHSPGGSSGGSAAAVAARILPAAHGGDGGGSIRIPASACGVFGLKPTRGRNPWGPDLGEGWGGFAQEHVLTVSVRDSAALLDVTGRPELGDPYCAPPPERPWLEEVGRDPGALRIAFTGRSLYGQETHPDCLAALQDAATLCGELGHHVEEACPEFDREAMISSYLLTVAAGVARRAESAGEVIGRPLRPSDVEPGTWFMVQIGRAYSALDLARSRDIIHRQSRRVAAFFQRYDLLLTPTLAQPPVKLGVLDLSGAERAGLALLRSAGSRRVLGKVLTSLAGSFLERTPNTQLFNQTGQPAMSVPLFWTDAGRTGQPQTGQLQTREAQTGGPQIGGPQTRQPLPIGVQFAGRFGDEATLFRLAAQLEAARPWAQRTPPGVPSRPPGGTR